MTLTEKLEHLRQLMDTNLKELPIEEVILHAKELVCNMGLSAECKSEAKQELEEARLASLRSWIGNKKLGPMILLKMVEGECAEKVRQFEYADRLNAGITHSLDLIRTIISYEKQERISHHNNAQLSI